ncbi:MAG: class I SAM-dependent methyltransferase [Deltaproteobacteria bacterium]|nr:class I SAM-dependent methyltransferase [Deltaproteobacteria bacterium]MBW2318249.1 class I SAM-dependent methyltransferase [Deltaproteobacteria bacterium]MBW2600482.1 class I SAM-dependent methyltransferase [Deltaproteobacteria bacterium]OEU45669.1 MAG: hypothetical protein BBJ60_08340 [Desulfobacterales bacterium S7086C20]
MKIRISTDWWKTMFDEIYLLTDARSVCDPDITSREVDLICKLLSIKVKNSILDLCGGHGRHSLELCARGFNKCTLLDYSGYLLDCARAKAADHNYPIELIQADARSTGLASESFDHVIIMGNSLGYIGERDADRQILTEAKRVLCSGGWFVVDVANGTRVKESFNPRAWHEIGQDIVVCRERSIEGDSLCAREMVLSKKDGIIRDCSYGIHLYEPQGLEMLMKEIGFRKIKIYTDFSPHKGEGDYGFMNHRMLGVGRKLKKIGEPQEQTV